MKRTINNHSAQFIMSHWKLPRRISPVKLAKLSKLAKSALLLITIGASSRYGGNIARQLPYLAYEKAFQTQIAFKKPKNGLN